MQIKELYSKYDIKEPNQPYEERHKKRLAWRNERNMYKRKCDLSGEEIIAIYPQNTPFPVYTPNAWYSDDWDPIQYGKDLQVKHEIFSE